ncbi:hypothetical protein BDP67DRAFT_606214, partial [Colletotrichum lupini]
MKSTKGKSLISPMPIFRPPVQVLPESLPIHRLRCSNHLCLHRSTILVIPDSIKTPSLMQRNMRIKNIPRTITRDNLPLHTRSPIQRKQHLQNIGQDIRVAPLHDHVDRDILAKQQKHPKGGAHAVSVLLPDADAGHLPVELRGQRAVVRVEPVRDDVVKLVRLDAEVKGAFDHDESAAVRGLDLVGFAKVALVFAVDGSFHLDLHAAKDLADDGHLPFGGHH